MPNEQSQKPFADHYECLQLSPNADFETIERVYRLLAKRYHPDNNQTGHAEKFRALIEAYQVLSDPEKRAAYDAKYEAAQSYQWKTFVESSSSDNGDTDKNVQMGILSLLYKTRRQDALNPGIGSLDLQRIIGFPGEHMEFHIWYLKEKGWIKRTDNGMFAITADGVDLVAEKDIIFRADRLLPPGQASSSENNDPHDTNTE
jgi:curved DNA-binding protein CbpA